MNFTNMTMSIAYKNDNSIAIMFIVTIVLISIGLGCCGICYLILCIMHMINVFTFRLPYNSRNLNPRIKYVYDILFGTVSTPILTDIITYKIDNQLS